MPRVERDLFERLCLARELLQDLRQPPLRVREIADRVTVSRFHFLRRFEQVFGATPTELRTAARIEHAKRLLARGERSVTDVCFEVGFSSLGSFSALFKRRVGETPRDYQRRLRALVPVTGAWPEELAPGCLSLMGRLPSGAFRTSEEA
jgi:AraC-like DNA-binding protein